MTCPSAWMANRVSVAVAESDTIRSGSSAISTRPFSASIVTGKAAGVVVGAVSVG